MFLFDTTAVSELEKPRPNQGLVDWLGGVSWDDVYLSAVTIAEVRLGINRLPNGEKRRRLEAWFDSLTDQFPDRILPIDFHVAVRFAEIQHEKGPLPLMDSLIAATALTHRLTVVTNNTSDLGRTGASVVDPWA
jgi:toxin FitB